MARMERGDRGHIFNALGGERERRGRTALLRARGRGLGTALLGGCEVHLRVPATRLSRHVVKHYVTY